MGVEKKAGKKDEEQEREILKERKGKESMRPNKQLNHKKKENEEQMEQRRRKE